MNDLKFAIRQLSKNPGFTAVAVLTLALGIGATTATTSVLRAALFEPLPMPHAERFLSLFTQNVKGGWQADGLDSVAARAVEAATNLFCRTAISRVDSLTLEKGEFPRHLGIFRVTKDFFDLSQVRPLHGRLPSDDDYRPGFARAMVLGATAWQSFFGSDPSVIGRTVMFKEGPVTITGVLPDEFRFPSLHGGAWMAWSGPGDVPGAHGGNGSMEGQVDVELQPGITRDQAQAWLDVLHERLARLDSRHRDTRFMAEELTQRFVRPELTRTLWALLGATVLVLVIAASNLAHLQLARTEARRQELAVRAALGAGRRRVFRQLLVESLLIAVSGGAAGLLVTCFGLEVLVKLLPPDLPRLRAVTVDWSILGVASLITLFTGIFFGLLPAWRGEQTSLTDSLNIGAPRSTADRSRLGFTGALVVGQIALSLLLLTGAGLMIRSVQELLRVDVGYNPSHLVKLYPEVDLASFRRNGADGPARLQSMFMDLRQRLATLPGVEGAGLFQSLDRRAKADTRAGTSLDLKWHRVGAAEMDPLRVLQARLTAGRWLTRADAISGDAIILNETAVRRLWPAGPAVGHPLQLDLNGARKVVIVAGVIADLRQEALGEEPVPALYQPAESVALDGAAPFLAIRTTADYGIIRPAVHRELKMAGLGKEEPWVSIVEDALLASMAGQRTLMAYLSVFAVTGLFLSALGLYGVLAFNVTCRTREIGIRMALGAARSEVIGLVIHQGMKVATIGVLLGIAGAFAGARVLRSFLFGIGPTDAITFLAVALLLSLVVLVASWLPARRAARVDPMVALRTD